MKAGCGQIANTAKDEASANIAYSARLTYSRPGEPPDCDVGIVTRRAIRVGAFGTQELFAHYNLHSGVHYGEILDGWPGLDGLQKHASGAGETAGLDLPAGSHAGRPNPVPTSTPGPAPVADLPTPCPDGARFGLGMSAGVQDNAAMLQAHAPVGRFSRLLTEQLGPVEAELQGTGGVPREPAPGASRQGFLQSQGTTRTRL